MKISIIVPVYNSEAYLRESISSVLSQDFADFELILVNDGSTDNSGEICDCFSQKDARVTTIHKKNGGLCSARNKGIDEAKGKYIAFMDNDDLYLPKLLSDNIRIAEEFNSDWVRFNRKRVTTFEDGESKIDIFGTYGIADSNSVVSYSETKIRESLPLLKSSGCLNGIWNAIFKASIIKENGLYFDEEIKYGGEDWVFNLHYLKYVKNIIFNGNVYYEYKRRYTHSISTQFNENRLLGVIKTLQAEQEYLKFVNQVSLQQRVLTVSDTLMEIVNMLFQKNCNWNFKKKTLYLKELKNEEYFRMKLSKDEIKFLWKLQKIKYLLTRSF